MSWYRVVDSEWQETKRALGRFVARGYGYATWAEFAAANPGNDRPVPIYVNPNTGTRFVQIPGKFVRWAQRAIAEQAGYATWAEFIAANPSFRLHADATIGGDRMRLGTRVDVDQLPQWLRNRIEQDQQDT